MHTERLLVIRTEAKKLGLDLVLTTFDATTVFKTMQDKKHEIAWHGWGTQMRPNYWGQYHKDNADIPNTNNLSNVKDDELSKLIDQYRDALDSEVKVPLAHKIEEKINELCVAHPTYKVPYFREGIWNWVKYPDFIATRTSENSVTDYGLFWIDTEVKKAVLEAKRKGREYTDPRNGLKIYKPYEKK